MNLMGVGPLELLVILVVALLVLGPARLVSSGRTMGKLMRELRRATEGLPNLVEDLLESDGSSSAPEDTSKQSPLPSPPEAQPRRRNRRKAEDVPSQEDDSTSGD